MRALLVALMFGLLVTAASADIVVPSMHVYVESVSGADTTWVEVEVTDVQQAIDLSYMLINHPFAGYPGHDEVVLLSPGRYDSVSTFSTVFGVKTAVAKLFDGVTLRGFDRDVCLIDQRSAEYGILCEDVGAGAVVENLTVTGGGSRDRGRVDDGDGRDLVAGIACLDGGSPTIRNVSIEGAATGVVVNTLHDDAAPTIEGTVIARGSHHGVYIKENGATPVTIHETTIVQNFDVGIYVFGGSAAITNSSVTHNGREGIRSYLVDPVVEMCNVWWNDRGSDVPANYGGDLTDLTGVDGNISEEPFYCDFTGIFGYDYHVCVASPNIPPQSAEQIGAFGMGCTSCESPVAEVSWGAIKALYR